MIDTVTIKAKLREVFEIGSGSEETILVLGSCRCVPYINYLDRYNRSAGEPFKIYAIEPNNYHWSEQGQPVNLEEELTKLETNERILSILKSTTIFIHEHYANFQLFNTSRDSEKNIYQFGMSPKTDISIPNWHDHLILENDWVDYGGTTPDDYVAKGWQEIVKFANVCFQTSFPEMADYFRDNWRAARFFWRPNHVSSVFTLYIFDQMNRKFLHLDLSDEFWGMAVQEDLFRDPHTTVTDRDRKEYGIKW